MKYAAIPFCLILFSPMVEAMPSANPLALHQHGARFYHAFQVEGDIGASQEGQLASWDVEGWVGGDYNKLWVKAEGERLKTEIEQAEFWALYSRHISTFWDFQLGVRYDTQPASFTYAAMGFNGLAPYFVETEGHLFVSEKGDVSARLEFEKDFLLTQRLILQPYLESHFYAQRVEESDIGAGLSNAEMGLQLRYEITKQFAPYFDAKYERKFGETSSIAKGNKEHTENSVVALGLRLMF